MLALSLPLLISGSVLSLGVALFFWTVWYKNPQSSGLVTILPVKDDSQDLQLPSAGEYLLLMYPAKQIADSLNVKFKIVLENSREDIDLIELWPRYIYKEGIAFLSFTVNQAGTYQLQTENTDQIKAFRSPLGSWSLLIPPLRISRLRLRVYRRDAFRSHQFKRGFLFVVSVLLFIVGLFNLLVELAKAHMI